MTDSEQRESARQFIYKWHRRGREDEDDRSYWLDILERVLGVQNATDRIDFQKKVIVDGNTKKIDAYIPETRVLIEQKSLGIALDKKIHQSDGTDLTPYEQGKRYNDNLPYDEKARWIISSNFAEIWIYDMNMQVPEPVKLSIIDLQAQYHLLNFLINHEQTRISFEMQVSKKAGDLVGEIYDALYKQYFNPDNEYSLRSLNMLCVRLVFCMYAEDAGIFSNSSRTMFHDYLNSFAPKDMRRALIDLFHILDTKPEDRDPYESSELLQFPYVNGGLFSDENIEIPNFTEEIKDILINHASSDFDWSDISPTIFGAIFESTLNPETRRSGGMHYTSIENIHKVIDPLFLDALKAELAEIKQIGVQKTRENKLKTFQNKLASLKWFDPACGSGNFLTETYISIRRLENDVINELRHGQIVFGEVVNPIKVSINQFYGIEINDFAVTVAKTALWIAESQMMKETEDIVHMSLDFLPLTTNAFIFEGNALTKDWKEIIAPTALSFIMGNPPFIGARQMDKDKSLPKEKLHQKKDMEVVFGKLKGLGNLDYVCGWYKKAADYIAGTSIKVAFVSTNSITQGEQPGILWKMLHEQGIYINFAYRTFQWDSEAHIKAHVHCVIIGFSNYNEKPKLLVNGDSKKIVNNINAYLFDGPDIFLEKLSKPLCNVSLINYGSFALDDGNYTISKEEYNEICKKDPKAIPFLKPFIGAQELLHSIERYCVWLKDASPVLYGESPVIMDKIKKVREWRSKSTRKNTLELANTPSIFAEIRQPDCKYLAVPTICSEKRRCLPIKFLNPDTIASNQIYVIPNATLYDYGILISNVHNAWIRAIGGRLKSDLRYSSGLIYNNFPWPEASEEQKKNIEITAQQILDVQEKYSDCSLDVLFNREKMKPELKKALDANDRAVMKAYGLPIKETSEEMCVTHLMNLYKKLTEN